MSKAKCPGCGGETGVTYTYYPKVTGVLVARPRRCDGCGLKFTTYEVVKSRHDAAVELMGMVRGIVRRASQEGD